MDRGPLALFGAIIAVGLGPALWLGAQFGTAGPQPSVPVTVVVEDTGGSAPGGAGAADDTGPVEQDDPPSHRPRTARPAGDPARVARRAPKSSTSPSTSAPTTRQRTIAPSEPVDPGPSTSVSAGPSASTEVESGSGRVIQVGTSVPPR